MDNPQDISFNNEAVVEEVKTGKKKKKSDSRQKNADTYAPDRPLPQTLDGIAIPDTDAPHTQLGRDIGWSNEIYFAEGF